MLSSGRSLARPKSQILHTRFSSTSTLRAARSRWTICEDGTDGGDVRSLMLLYVYRDRRDWEPRTATSTFTQPRGSDTTFTQLLISETVKCCFTSTETIRTTRDGHLDFHTVPELWEARSSSVIIIMCIYHALINALSAHMIHINLKMIFYKHVEHSPTKTIYIKYY